MKRLFKSLLILGLVLSLVGCKSGSNIKGTWKSEFGLTYTFNSDGTGLLSAGFGDPVEFTYTLNEDELEIVTTNDYQETVELYLIKVEDNKLKMAEKTEGSSLNYLIYNKVEESKKGEESQLPDLDNNSLKEIVEFTVNEVGEWAEFAGCAYCDWKKEYNGNYSVTCDDIKTIDDIKAYVSKAYTAEATERIMGAMPIEEYDGVLYTGIYGIGGIGYVIKEVTAAKDGDTYRVTFHIYEYDWETGNVLDKESSSSTFTLVNENGEWKFNDLVRLGLDYFSDDVTFTVE